MVLLGDQTSSGFFVTSLGKNNRCDFFLQKGRTNDMNFDNKCFSWKVRTSCSPMIAGGKMTERGNSALAIQSFVDKVSQVSPLLKFQTFWQILDHHWSSMRHWNQVTARGVDMFIEEAYSVQNMYKCVLQCYSVTALYYINWELGGGVTT